MRTGWEATDTMSYEITRGTHNGSPTLTITDNNSSGRFGPVRLTAGCHKWRMVMDPFVQEQIKAFLVEHDKGKAKHGPEHVGATRKEVKPTTFNPADVNMDL